MLPVLLNDTLKHDITTIVTITLGWNKSVRARNCQDTQYTFTLIDKSWCVFFFMWIMEEHVMYYVQLYLCAITIYHVLQ